MQRQGPSNEEPSVLESLRGTHFQDYGTLKRETLVRRFVSEQTLKTILEALGRLQIFRSFNRFLSLDWLIQYSDFKGAGKNGPIDHFIWN